MSRFPWCQKDLPTKPESRDDQIGMLWDAVYNHIPTWMRWQDRKLNFILVLCALTLAASGAKLFG